MSETMNIRAPGRLVAALDRAAADRLTSRSEYVRQAVIDRLRRDGVGPNALEAQAA
jgi:metal-responsive CopG/Arc/MetJ family transcriptional regulator